MACGVKKDRRFKMPFLRRKRIAFIYSTGEDQNKDKREVKYKIGQGKTALIRALVL